MCWRRGMRSTSTSRGRMSTAGISIEERALVTDRHATLVVIQGQAPNTVFPLKDGRNLIGRGHENTEQHPVDINLVSQEPPNGVSVSRKHAVIHVQGDQLSIEDVGSSWGTVVNNILVRRGMVHPL